jgi:hypothetical protein
MNDIVADPSTESKLAELERRLNALESKVAALPDQQQIEEHVTERVKASLPPPVDPAQSPGFKDIALPIPNVNTIVATAKTTWTLFTMFGEMKTMLWMLIDRRYHMGWTTRIITLVLLAFILVSHFLWPWGRWDMIVSPILDKLTDLVIGLILFMVLHFEMRRYKEWRGIR